MGNAKYGFLPWMRQGIANRIATFDDPNDTSLTGRVQLPVTIKYSKDGTPVNAPVISKNIQLIGPGDITGINSNAIVRCEPINGVFDFEANYLPYIEFYEEDFPWRYTPVAPAGQKIRPWLALIVLKDSEFSFVSPAREDLPAAIEITGTLTDIFHPYAQHWAWAHVHVFKPRDITGSPTSTDKDNFLTDLSQDPDIAVSRILCPRRLEKKTQYTAFLIPSFEAGRRAGLNIAEDPQNPTKRQESSWKNTANTKFPFYYQWRFGTAELGDFETLVRALKPRTTDPLLGGREMDISKAGMGLDDLFKGSTPVLTDATVTMEGALKPPTFSSGTIINYSNGDEYSEQLSDLINLSAVMQTTSFAAHPPQNPISQDINTALQLDPVVLPPLYGQWHANVKSIDASSPLWVQELNLDVRYRATAGIGAQVVRDNQEKFMEVAWRQIGEVMAANDKILKAQFAIEASKAVYAKHLVGNIHSLQSVADKFDKIVKVAGAGFKKIQLQSKIPGAPSTDKLSAKKTTGYMALTEAPVNNGFKKLTRNRSLPVQRADSLNSSSVKEMIYSNLENTVVTASELFQSPEHVRALSASDQSFLNAKNGTQEPYSMVRDFPTSTWQFIYYHHEYEFYRTQWFYDQVEAQYTKQINNVSTLTFPKPGTSTFLDFPDYVLEMLEPAAAITKRVSKLIQLQKNGNISSLATLKPIMAYPVFDKPMFEELMKLSNEYLLPNASQYPNNSITLLQTNTRFIEAYFAGLNHEFSRELLWREYPTDQKGSYFRKFWNTDDTIDRTDNDPNSPTHNPDYLFDIEPMHNWANSHLGANHKIARHGASEKIVLLIKGDFLKKFPNALIYLQKAHKPGAQRTLTPVAWDLVNKPHPDVVKFPLFKASVQPDISLLGFDISKDDAVGGTMNSEHGWFVVFRERPGQIKFGLDEPPLVSFDYWNDINWVHMGGNPRYVDLNAPFNNPTSTQGLSWGVDSASMASILYQKPVIIAVHADDMLP